MEHNIKSDRLIIPIYINEKIVLDMLAIMEDGFSMVSQINYTEHKENSSSQKIDAGISTSASILSKLLKIDVSGGISHEGNKGENESIVKEKIHTNVGKVIFICKEDTENIDLLRKTSLSILQEDLLNEMFAEFKTEDMKQFNLPELKTKIEGPAAIVIPIAIYA